MRFIRDIINENRADTNGPQNEEKADSRQSQDPLLLEEPTFPQQKAQDPRAPQPAPFTDSFEDFDEEEDEELEAMMRSLEAEDAQIHAMQGENTSAPLCASADPEPDMNTDAESAAYTGSDVDPFDKLRATQPATSPETPPVSPLRNLRKTPDARLSAELPEAEAEATDPAQPAPPQADLPVDALTPLADAASASSTAVPSPAIGRGSAKSGRVKTRLLGFSAGAIERKDPFDKPASLGAQFPVGWLVVTSDKGRGAAFALHDGVSKIGRGTDQTVCLDFGDNSISRDNHLSIAFDAEQNKFFVGHSGKSNLVRLNNKPLLSTEELRSKDMIRLGETTLRFIALCEDDFGWDTTAHPVAQHA